MAAPLPALFQLLSARAGFLQARHAVLAQNLANADTPRYQPQDLVEPDFEALLRAGPGSTSSVSVARTRSAHLAGATPLPASPRQRPVEAKLVADLLSHFRCRVAAGDHRHRICGDHDGEDEGHDAHTEQNQ